MLEFFVQKGRLQDEMQRLSGVVEKKSTIPLLENTKIEPLPGSKIKMAATDLDLSIFSECTVNQVTGETSVCVPSRQLFDVVKVMPEGVLKITVDDGYWVMIQAGGSNFRIPGIDPANFPESPKLPANEDWISIPCKVLSNTLKGVQFAASQSEDNRFAIHGVKMEINDTQIRMVATDGYRISLSSANHGALLLNTLETLIPAKGVSELSKLVADFDGEVGIYLTDNGLFFKVADRILHTRLLGGQFPHYQPAFDLPYATFATFKADDFARSVKRTMVVAESKLGGMIMSFQNNQIHLNASRSEAGECYEILASNFNGGPLSLACSAKFMLEFLDQMSSDVVKMQIKDANTPLQMVVEREGIKHQYVLIPMRIDSIKGLSNQLTSNAK